MSRYARREGFVELDTDELNARCSKCFKTISYPKGMRLKLFSEILKAFIKKHRECGNANAPTD